MGMTLKTKISVTLVGTLALAMIGSVVALLSAWQSRQITGALVVESVADARAVAQLEISLLEQRGFVSSYVLSGEQAWLEELARREPSFLEWLRRVREMPKTPEERRTVARLDEVFKTYDAARNEVIALYDHGDRALARELLLSRVTPSYDKAYQLCEDLVGSTRERVESEIAEGRRAVKRVSLIVLGCVLLTFVLGAVLLWFFFRGILLPLRRMADDARLFRGPGHLLGASASPRDELRAVGLHLQALMTDVREARTQLVNAEKLVSVGKLAACVAHEIRNPLTSLKMRLFAISREIGRDPLYEDDLRVISEEVERLEGVIRNFLEFARPPDLRARTVGVPLILDKSLELVRHRFVEKDIKLERDGEDGLPEVSADPQQMKQVFVNLLMNAADATVEGGTIRLASSADGEAGGQEAVTVRVGDSGKGIPEESRQRVFEPFFSLKDEGTGLGLCIAARIVARHGGMLELESAEPGGTVFAVHIPVATAGGGDEQDTGG